MEFEERMYKITKPASEIREKLSDAKERLKALGQVNLMAVEEFAEEKERYERQQTNYDDTKKSLENLQRVSGEIKSKSSASVYLWSCITPLGSPVVPDVKYSLDRKSVV